MPNCFVTDCWEQTVVILSFAGGDGMEMPLCETHAIKAVMYREV